MKSSRDDEYGHGQEKMTPSTYVEGIKVKQLNVTTRGFLTDSNFRFIIGYISFVFCVPHFPTSFYVVDRTFELDFFHCLRAAWLCESVA